MLRTIALGTLLCASAVTVAYADVYRWVDEHGVVHYTDQWVPGAEVIKATKPHPASSGSDSSHSSATDQKGAEHAADQLREESQARAVQQDVAKVRAQQCKEAKDRYEKAIIAKRIYKQTTPTASEKDEDRPADREYLSDAEADAYRLKARQQMDDLCGPGAANAVEGTEDNSAK